VQFIVGPDWTSDPLPPVLQPIRALFPEWLWKRCNEVLDSENSYPCTPGMTLTERARVLRLAVSGNPNRETLISYPRRPSAPSASSESIEKLREILAGAPRILEGGSVEETPGMVEVHEGWPDDGISYEWDDDYFDEVLQALIEVVEQHGVGDEGWASARWEVYDTVRICFVGKAALMLTGVDRQVC
jgi:hypothetical protein